MRNSRPTLMLGHLYAALKEAGVDEDLARRASEEAAECLLRGSRHAGPAGFDMVHLMGALNVALTAIILVMLFTPG